MTRRPPAPGPRLAARPVFRSVLMPLLSCAALALGACDDGGDGGDGLVDAAQAERVTGSTVVPDSLGFTEERLASLRVPAGFRVTAFATGLGKPRMMAVADDGTVYVTRQMQNDVVALRDRDGDGRAEERRTAAANLEMVHGIALRGSQVWLVAPTRLWRTTRNADGTFATPTLLSSDLPPAGQHRARTLAIGPDNLLYISAGSTCNACEEPDNENATMMRAGLDGSGRTVIARGLRHTVGFGWHPTTGELWGMDMQADWRGDDQPREELNRIVAGRHYGWPYCYEARRADRAYNYDPPGATKDAFCPTTESPALTLQAHNAPIGMAFYTGAQFPAEYRNDAFVALRGSWNRNPPGGYKVVRIRFENGQPVRAEDFVTGWLVNGGRAQFARVTGVAVARDGALLVADDSNGVIYRVSYSGTGAAR
jgi:glucose/arabinose dehydrogenase